MDMTHESCRAVIDGHCHCDPIGVSLHCNDPTEVARPHDMARSLVHPPAHTHPLQDKTSSTHARQPTHPTERSKWARNSDPRRRVLDVQPHC